MSVILLPARFRQQPQRPARLDKGHWFGSKATFAITGAIPDFNAATGKSIAIASGGSGFSTRATIRGKALYTPNGGWANLSVDEDWSGPSTIIALCRVSSIDNPWGGLFVKHSTSTNAQFAVGRSSSTDFLYGEVAGASSSQFAGSSITGLNTTGFAVLAFSHPGSGSPATYYKDGIVVGSTGVLGASAGSGALGLGRSRDALAAYDSDVDWIAFLRAPFAATPTQVKEISDNIWALWKAPSRRLWSVSSAGTTHDLTAANVTQANVASTDSIIQSHALTGAASAQTNIGATGAISQGLALVAGSVAQTNTAPSVAITQDHGLFASASAQSNTASTGAVSQGAQFSANPSTQVNVSGAGAITQAHALAGVGSTQSQTASAASITQVHVLAGESATQANVAPSGAISTGVVHNLVAAQSTQANTGSASAITQAHVLVCPASIQDNIAASSAIVQAHVLAALSATQGNSASSGAITAGNNVLVSVVERTATFRRSKSVTVRFN